MNLETFLAGRRSGLFGSPPATKASPEGLKKAAVLILVCDQKEGAALGLIHRPHSMDIHADQVSFPGGHIEPGETVLQTALRETEEEIGISREAIEVAGFMSPVKTVSTGYIVWPVVGVLHNVPDVRLKEDEADDFFWTPVDFFMNEINLGIRQEVLKGEKTPRPAYHRNGYEIWGLTLRIITNLVSRF